MSRNSQQKYLSELLSGDEGAESLDSARPVPSPSPLLSRANSLGRLASGEIKQVTQLRLDPAKCRIWPGNGRDYNALTAETCQDLIDAIKAEGGQKIPALVRRVKDDANYEYEVIYGTRRHWTISYLRAHSYPEMTFLAEVREIDDEAAFRLADIENRSRKDITELERARNYAMALPLHYGGKQARMAERLNLSPGWLSKMLSFASVPSQVLDAFANPGSLSLRQGYRLFQAASSPEGAKRTIAEAETISAEQRELAARGKASLGTEFVLAQLLKAASHEQNAPAEPRSFFHDGKTLLTVLDETRNGLRLQVHAGTGASIETILESVKQALCASRFNQERNEA
jgi:ParB family chromosome partitioning protein